MTASGNPIRVLSHALDQAGDMLAGVHERHLGLDTPCSEWKVAQLVDHVVATPGRFLQMMRGEQPDWAAEPPRIREDWAGAFRSSADDLIHAWHQRPPEEAPGADWQTADMAVHTWDLARAIGRGTDDLDPEVAERGLAFMRDNLTAENRGPAFDAEQPAPEGAPPYDLIAAFAGRTV